MNFFRFAPFRGPKAYKFKDPDSGKEYEARTMQELCSQVRGYRSQNGLAELEFLETVVENYLCSLPENIGGCEPSPKLKRGMFQSLKGGIAILQNVLYNKTVSQEIADSRSEICKDCPHNVFPDKGLFLFWSDQLAEASTGGKKSKFHNDLGNCEVCTCPLRCKVWFAGKIELSDKEQLEMKQANPKCWQVTENVR